MEGMRELVEDLMVDLAEDRRSCRDEDVDDLDVERVTP